MAWRVAFDVGCMQFRFAWLGCAAVWARSISVVTILSAGLTLLPEQEASAQNAPILCDPTIAASQMRRHLARINQAKTEGVVLDTVALELSMNARVKNLCALDIQTKELTLAAAAIKQETAAIKQETAAKNQETAAILAGAQRKEQEAAAILAGAQRKEQAAAADKQAAAVYREMGAILKAIET
jgi:hypothetical protein